MLLNSLNPFKIMRFILLLRPFFCLFYWEWLTVAAQRFFCPIDEEYHFLRAFDLTNGRILPADAGGWVPAGYDEYATRYGWSFSEMLQCPSLWLSEIKELEFVYHIRAASYLPFSYIPSAIGIGIARIFRLPLLGILYFGRLSNYLFYVGICTLAIWRTKTLRSLIFLAALSTGVFAHMGVICIDSPLICCALLFVSICLHYCFDKDAAEQISTRDIILLALSAAMVVSIKYFGYVLIVPVIFFLQKKRCKNKNTAVLFVGIAVLLIAAFQVYALLRCRGSLDNARSAEADSMSQLAYIFENPLRYAILLFRDMLGNVYERLLTQHPSNAEAFGAIGSFCAMLPMLGALLAQDRTALSGKDRSRWAVYCLMAAVIMQALCCTALYVSWTPVGEALIWSVQPRYTLPYYILIMIALSMPQIKNEMRGWPRLISYLSLLGVLNCASGMLLAPP